MAASHRSRAARHRPDRRSTPGCSWVADVGPRTAPLCCCCTGGRTTSTASRRSRRSSSTPGFGWSCRTSAASARRPYAPPDPRNAQQPVFAGTRSPCSMRSASTPSSAGSTGAPESEHPRRPCGPSVPGTGRRQRVPDRRPGGQRAPASAGRRTRLVVPVLLRDRTRSRRIRPVPRRVRPPDLADGFAAVGVRRRDLPRGRRGLRQPGPRRHRHPQLPVAARTGRPPRSRRVEPRLAAPPSRSRRSRWRAMPTAHRIPDLTAYRERFIGPYEHRLFTGGVGHNLPQEAPRAFADAIIDVERMRAAARDQGEDAHASLRTIRRPARARCPTRAACVVRPATGWLNSEPLTPRRSAAGWCWSTSGPTRASTGCARSLPARVAREVCAGGAHDRRRAHSGVRSSTTRQRHDRTRELGVEYPVAVDDDYGVGRLRQPLLARGLPRRRGRAAAVPPLRRGRVREHRDRSSSC